MATQLSPGGPGKLYTPKVHAHGNFLSLPTASNIAEEIPSHAAANPWGACTECSVFVRSPRLEDMANQHTHHTEVLPQLRRARPAELKQGVAPTPSYRFPKSACAAQTIFKRPLIKYSNTKLLDRVGDYSSYGV
eukprot:3894329-Amphidinium_carterae.2